MIALMIAAVAAAKPPVDFRSYLDQARFFVTREWYSDAKEQLELAVATEDGRIDPEAWFLLAKVRYELADLSGARLAADRALVNSRDLAQLGQTQDMLDFFKKRFGFVRLDATQQGITTSLSLTLDSTIFDPDLKRYINNLTEQLQEPFVLPYNLGLPAGEYTINGSAVTIAPGGQSRLAIQTLGTVAPSLQTLELEWGLGGTAWLGRGAVGLTPAPTTELSVGLPVGPVVVGAMVSWSPQPYRPRSGPLGLGIATWAAGVRLGVVAQRDKPIVVRPSAVLRAGPLAGVELACADRGATYLCSPDQPIRQLYVHAAPVVTSVGAELALLYRETSGSGGLAGGIKVGTEAGFGRFPSPLSAALDDRELVLDVREDARSWVGVSARVLGTLSYRF